MARRERALDPAAGPVAAFAHGLRQVRAAAGSPTYRALARTAGYSATTLSEAAGGSRLPTWDVTLAYVQACGGDVASWRDRWERTHAALAEVTPAAAPDAAPHDPTTVGAATPADVPAADPDHGASADAEAGGGAAVPWWRRQRPRRAVTVAAVALLGATTAAALRPGDAPSRAGTAPGCSAPAPGARFTAVVKPGGAHVRAGAHRDQPILRTLPHGCVVGFTGYCVGQLVRDLVAGYPDVRWFTVAGGGVVASAVVRGNPPRALPPGRCPADTPLPTALRLTHAATSPATLTATVTGARIVGFAVAERRGWRQLDLVEVPPHANGVRTPLGLPAGGAFTAVAVVCLGGDGPTAVADVRRFGRGGATPVALPPDARAAALGTACRYPDRG